jgi:hypothetical protein
MTTAKVGERRAPGAHGAVRREPRVAGPRTDTVLRYGCVLTVAVCHSRCLRTSSNWAVLTLSLGWRPLALSTRDNARARLPAEAPRGSGHARIFKNMQQLGISQASDWGSDPLSAWWLGLAPATLEFWVRFPNERNQEKTGAPCVKVQGSSRVPGSFCRYGQASAEAASWRANDGGRQRKTACPLLYRYRLTHTYYSLACPLLTLSSSARSFSNGIFRSDGAPCTRPLLPS